MANKVQKYAVRLIPHGQYAKTKALIAAGRDIIFCANSHEDAYAYLCKEYMPQDNRPISGKSYLYKCVLKLPKLGSTVKVLSGYPVGYDKDGNPIRAYYGKVSEIITDNAVSVEFAGYRTKFVDFGLSEIENISYEVSPNLLNVASRLCV